MKKRLTYFFVGVLVCVFGLAFTACEPETWGEDVAFVEYVHYVTENSGEKVAVGWWIEPDYFHTPWGEGVVVVINSDAELQKYIETGGYDSHSFDFSKQTLLLVGGGSYSSPVMRTVRSFQSSSNGNYMLEVAIALPDVVFGFGSGWRMAVLTDKINDGGKVRLKITVDE